MEQKNMYWCETCQDFVLSEKLEVPLDEYFLEFDILHFCRRCHHEL